MSIERDLQEARWIRERAEDVQKQRHALIENIRDQLQTRHELLAQYRELSEEVLLKPNKPQPE